MYSRVTALVAVLLAMAASGRAQSDERKPPLEVDGRRFLFRGEPLQILSGELEYARIPRADWHDRLRKVRALGLNTVTVYVFWNLHELSPGVYDFSGQNDVAEFIREAAEEDLHVILRPGPYVCAEWDLGGYPAWLLKDHAMVLRSAQPNYIEPVRRWMLRLGRELAPLQASRGGPIMAVQVENEYGSFAVQPDGGAYLRQMEQIVLDAGFGQSLLYTADGGDVMARGSLPNLFAAVDFGTGDAARSLALLRRFRPGAPVYAAEYWDGWFDHWGEKHQVTDAAKQEAEIRAVLAAGDSINLYMVHGGTTFGWYNGANSGGNSGGKSGNKDYQPDVSSYDYDAPLDESGRPRPKYFALREMIREVTHREPPPVPESPAPMKLAPLRLAASRSLWTKLPVAIRYGKPLSMEDVDQAYGYILYRTKVDGGSPLSLSASLEIDGLHSYARVYLDGRLAGVIDRRLGQDRLQIQARAGQRLDLLVENSGRINFTTAIRGERAGILGAVRLGGVELKNWQIVRLPLNEPLTDGFRPQACNGPCFYRGDLQMQTPGDTFLNTSTLGKGVIWVNGHLLGRFWNVGPMGSLFLPGAWLHAGSNQVTVLDLNGGREITVGVEDHATYVEPKSESTSPD